MDDQGCTSKKVTATGEETITINPDGLGQVTICCESGSEVEINFNTKHFHFHRVSFQTEEIVEIIKKT